MADDSGQDADGIVKARWTVRVQGRKPFAMVGEKMSRKQALKAARIIWPGAEVE